MLQIKKAFPNIVISLTEKKKYFSTITRLLFLEFTFNLKFMKTFSGK